MNILVTGGAGYIGSHTLVELYKVGHNVLVVDNLCNSSRESLRRVAKIVRIEEVPFREVDIRDREKLDLLFEENHFDACIHFAGLKAVGESVSMPWEYYDNNIGGTLTLLDVMRKHGCKKLIFSSSATVYGAATEMPIKETCPRGLCTNPYGWTKSMLEQVMEDMAKADREWRIVLLRYFNPVGAHESGLIGEDPNGVPNNLMPYISQVALGKREYLGVFGNDYETVDGTGVRDYIHVMDLAAGHVAALKALDIKDGVKIYNLGTGRGYSVLEMVQAFEQENGVKVPYVIQGRRAGDVAICYSDPSLAQRELGWSAKRGINEMVRDSWRWQQMNPDGYSK